MKKVCSLLLSCIIGFAFCARAEKKEQSKSSSPAIDKLILYGFKKEAPLMDGKLDDACWKNAQTAMGFCKLGTADAAAPDTRMKISYDEKNLYFGISVEEPLNKQLKSDKKSPWSGDCIELFIKPHQGNERLYHVIADAGGNIYSGINIDNEEKKLSLPIKAVTSLCNEGWTLEITIPLSAFHYSKPPVDNTEWRFNVTRGRRAAGRNDDYSSWAKLDQFTQQEKFGYLAFYSNPEIEADLAFWENSKRSGLMDRPEVSGVKFALENAGKEALPNLWDYSPFVKREKMAESWSMRGMTPGTKEKYPEMYQAASQLNSLLIEKSFTDEQLNELYRAGLDKAKLEVLISRSEKINDNLNKLYQEYGQAYKNDKNKMPASLFSDMDKAAILIKELAETYSKDIESLQKNAAEKHGKWTVQSFNASPDEKYLNRFGYSRRFLFAAHEFFANTDSLLQLGPFSTHTLHANYLIPKQKDSNAPWDYSFLETGIAKLKESPFKRTYCVLKQGLADLGTVMLPEIKDKPGVHMTSVDNLPPYTKGALGQERAANIHSKQLNEFLEKYFKRTWGEISKSGLPVDFFLFAQEAKNTFRVVTKDNKKEERSMGFTPDAQKSFHEYLKGRYASIEELNKRWNAEYKSFDEVNPVNDKFINRPSKLTGLAFEHERWCRVTFLRWLKGVKDLFHEIAPGIPAMEDMSYFLIDGNIYLAFKEDIADIMSFHTEPRRELPMWNFMYSINRKFGKILGYYENYWGMFSRKYMNNERLAKREVDKFFFELFMHDITVSAWWMRYYSGTGSYAAGYNHNPYYLEYDQTVFRWSTTALPVMFQKGLSVEKMLLETEIAKSKTAMIQPCTSVFALGALGYTVYDSPVITMLFDLHNNLFRPLNIPYEFLPEEMVLDKRASLSDYDCFILPYAPYMTADFSKQLKEWVEKGGTLIAVGPLSLYDETGAALPKEASLLKTVFPDAYLGTKPWDFKLSAQNENPGVFRKNFGKGKLIIFNRDPSMYLQDASLKPQLMEVFSKDIRKPVMCSDENFRSIIRHGKDGSVWLAINNTSANKPISTKFSIDGEFNRVYDVMTPGWMPIKTSVANGKTECAIALCPGDWTVLKLR
ncbi:MAG: hypothetical protein A2017_05275 [Lentisphaerae bacterium GWF2_44_16]|nr:MAG: hypothetical protein A2017_05275 [Lentisphaerae bacterium GWF2_44_16]